MEGCSEYLSAAGLTSAIQKNARDRIKKEALERKRNVLYLISSYLRENNLNTTAECLSTESQLSNDYEICDNVDLDTILQEYQSYYYTKFNKVPKITKPNKTSRSATPQTNHKEPPRRKSTLTIPSATTTKAAEKNDFQFEIRQLGGEISRSTSSSICEVTPLTKSLSDFEGYSADWREVADLILKEVVPSSLGVSWNDCVGLEGSIELLKEAVIYPQLYPELFSGLIAPWKGVLLYGPPGTGKTLLSKAVACTNKSTFFNVTSSCFVNKWRGESEKMIKVLFDLARFYAPSTIFIDELDGLVCTSTDYQHEASRRFKSELLVQLDGIMNNDDQIFVLGTSNKPWDLDGAVLRRFEKRILVDLPNESTREAIFKYYFAKNRNQFGEQNFGKMASLTESFSGSDIRCVCKEACMRKFREEIVKIGKKGVELKVSSPSMVDVVESIQCIRPVTNSRLQSKYLKWHDDFGCV